MFLIIRHKINQKISESTPALNVAHISLLTQQLLRHFVCSAKMRRFFRNNYRGAFRPEKILPFQVKKEDAQAAFKRLCHRKPLLPKDFYAPDRIEQITGVYVPFWLYDCAANAYMTASAQRIRTWSDRKYRYTKTDYYHIERGGTMDFERVPADGIFKNGR